MQRGCVSPQTCKVGSVIGCSKGHKNQKKRRSEKEKVKKGRKKLKKKTG